MEARLNYEFGDIVIDEILCHVGVGEVEGSWFQLYPNPAKDLVSIELLRQYSDLILKVYDTSGKVVVQTEVQDSYTLDVSAFPRGVYLAEISNSEKSFRKRLVLY